jgi:hypothetical protein
MMAATALNIKFINAMQREEKEHIQHFVQILTSDGEGTWDVTGNLLGNPMAAFMMPGIVQELVDDGLCDQNDMPEGMPDLPF